MNCVVILFASITLFISINVHAISNSAKMKYHDVLFTDDYGILTENDLASFVWGFKHITPFTIDRPSEHNIWQCFPRENVMVTLSDTGHSSEELGGRKNVAYLKIYADSTNGEINEYEMRANYTINDYQKRFNKWLRLMQGEKYVCLAGEFVDREKETKNGRLFITNGWVFERLKTKKGCDTYFESCTPTYAAYLQHEGESDKMLKRGK